MPVPITTDHLVVGAGAMGMAFADALVTHGDGEITLVDRRDAAGGHWRDAYPFVRLHQASVFYGVASRELGSGRIQQDGPEAGLHERAGLEEILRYYDEVLATLIASARVRFLAGHEYERLGDDHVVTSLATGERRAVRARRPVVDATYLAPTVPSLSPAPFEVDRDARVITVNELVDATEAAQHVIVGSGKTATDAIVWLHQLGVDPGRVVWVRPRDPWMLNRARVQPDPVVGLALASDIAEAAMEARDPDDLFLRLEARDVMFRIDPQHQATMARAPTLAHWELDLLRRVEHVVRMGHLRRVSRGALHLDGGDVEIASNSVVVHCAASGLRTPPLTPIWGEREIRLQMFRAGSPCLNAALAGYIEATREDDVERNRLCVPCHYGNTTTTWARMQAAMMAAAPRLAAEPDIAQWVNDALLNPGRVPPERATEPEVAAARSRLHAVAAPATDALAILANGRVSA